MFLVSFWPLSLFVFLSQRALVEVLVSLQGKSSSQEDLGVFSELFCLKLTLYRQLLELPPDFPDIPLELMSQLLCLQSLDCLYKENRETH